MTEDMLAALPPKSIVQFQFASDEWSWQRNDMVLTPTGHVAVGIKKSKNSWKFTTLCTNVTFTTMNNYKLARQPDIKLLSMG